MGGKNEIFGRWGVYPPLGKTLSIEDRVKWGVIIMALKETAKKGVHNEIGRGDEISLNSKKNKFM